MNACRHRRLVLALIFVCTSLVGAGPALAQYGGVFGYGIELLATGARATNSGVVTLYALNSSGTTRLLPEGSSATLDQTSWAGGSQAIPVLNLGTFNPGAGDTLILRGGAMLTYQGGGATVGPAIYLNYAVIRAGGPYGGFGPGIPLGLNKTNVNGTAGDIRWADESQDIDLLGGLAPGTYLLATYGYANSSLGDQFANNGGANYGAVFSVVSDLSLPPNPHQAPVYWSGYEHYIVKEQDGETDIYMPESEMVSNINFVDVNLKSSGYNMICMDGWGDVTRLSPNGYRAAHSRHWEHDYAWWSGYLQQRGMRLGIYGNPLWIHVSPTDTSTMIVGTSLPVSSLINTSENAGFQWCQVDRPGAEQYVKGCVKYYADMGVNYFRIDFLSWYESGWDRYQGVVGPTNRPPAHYETALRWMREAAETNGMFLSLVMPDLNTVSNVEALVERKYGHMIRINEDAGEGQWWKWSDKDRGIKRSGWSVYANAMDGLTYWSYISGRSNMILDPDFLRINTLASNDEKKSVVSACFMAGGAVTPTDQHKTIGNDVWVYVNPELLALRTDGFTGAPKINDPTLAGGQIWKGRMQNGDWIVGLFNREGSAQIRSISFAELGLDTAYVRDLWAHTNLGTMSSFSASLPMHGCRVLKVSTNPLSGPLPMHVQALTNSTQPAPLGGSLGAATVSIRDNSGNPVSGATVSAVFSGSYDEKVSGVTGSNGVATLVTTGHAAGNIKVTTDVSLVTHPSYAYSADQNLITSAGDRMFIAGTFNHWRLRDNPMRFVDGVWQAISVRLQAGYHEMKFADTRDWAGDDWGNATGLSGTAHLTTAGGPNLTFTLAQNGLYTITFNPVTLAYAIQLQWRSEDVGSVARTGSAGYDRNGIFTVLASGWDIWSTSDTFRYVYQTNLGSCEIRARVAGVQNTDPWAKAGLMIRETNTADAPYVAVLVTAGNGVIFQWRTATAGAAGAAIAGGPSAPQWVRILRSGNTFRGYYSDDGVIWTQIGADRSLSMSANATVGLAATSHRDGTLTTASFDNVFIGPFNTPPVLATAADRTIMAGRTLTVICSATDADLPAQALIYSLASPPAGAAINATNGLFTWRPTMAQSPSTQSVSVVVSDSGTPSLSATQDFRVTVTPPSRPVINEASIVNGQFGFSVAGNTGPDCLIQTSTNLTTWSDLVTLAAPPFPFHWSDTNSTRVPPRFYRVMLGP